MRLTVGFHNFNLRIFNLTVSNPSKLIVDDVFDTMSYFNVPESRPNKNTTKFRKSAVQKLSTNNTANKTNNNTYHDHNHNHNHNNKQTIN